MTNNKETRMVKDEEETFRLNFSVQDAQIQSDTELQ